MVSDRTVVIPADQEEVRMIDQSGQLRAIAMVSKAYPISLGAPRNDLTDSASAPPDPNIARTPATPGKAQRLIQRQTR